MWIYRKVESKLVKKIYHINSKYNRARVVKVISDKITLRQKDRNKVPEIKGNFIMINDQIIYKI